MKPKTLFLAKFFAYSLALFVVRNPIADVYISVLNHIVKSLNYLDNFVSGGNRATTEQLSLLLIPLASFIFATPRTGIARKTVFLVGGTVMFLLADVFLIEYVIVIREGKFRSEKSGVYSAYESVKWLLPFLVWIIMVYPRFDDLLRSSQKVIIRPDIKAEGQALKSPRGRRSKLKEYAPEKE